MRVYKATFFYTILVIAFGLLPPSQAELPSWMCGPYTLCQVAERHGVVIKPEKVAALAGTTKAGTTMKGLADAASQLGMQPVGQKTNYRHLRRLTPPLIALVKTPDNSSSAHFIVVDKIERNQIEIWDVRQGYSILPKKNFESMWEGYVLVLSPPRPQGGAPADAPDIEIDAPTYDFGVIPQMEKVEHSFTIKNVGGGPLEILEVDPSCTCEKVDLREKVIPPGGTTQLDVRYRGSTNSGKTRVAVYLKTNDPDELEMVVSLFGIVNGTAGVYPGHFHLGEIGQEELIRKSFVIYRPAFDTIRVKSVKSSSPQVQTKFQRLDETDLIARVHFDLQGLPLGPFRETITVTTDAKKYSEIYVGIEGTVVGELLLEPNQFFTGFLQVDTPVRRSITLEKRGKADLEILKVENSLSIVQTKIVLVEPGKKYEIEVTCTPTMSSPKSIRDVIQIHTNSKKQPLLKVPLYGLLQKTTASAGQDN
jgi:hypothetical protein